MAEYDDYEQWLEEQKEEQEAYDDWFDDWERIDDPWENFYDEEGD